jgi:hypothetical protein
MLELNLLVLLKPMYPAAQVANQREEIKVKKALYKLKGGDLVGERCQNFCHWWWWWWWLWWWWWWWREQLAEK